MFTWTFWSYFASLSNLTWLVLNYPSLMTLVSMIALFLFSHFPLYSMLIVTFNVFLSSSYPIFRQALYGFHLSSTYTIFTFHLCCSCLSLSTHEFLEYQQSFLMGFPTSYFSSSSLSCLQSSD